MKRTEDLDQASDRMGCAIITRMDKQALGARVARAREDVGLTQAGLGRAVDLDRTAISRLETGERKLSVPEMVAIADVLKRPLSFFLQAPSAVVISRRNDTSTAHDTTFALDAELEQFTADIRFLDGMALLDARERPESAATPEDHVDAERLAQAARRGAGLASEPVPDLSAACERLGLLTFSAPLGQFGPDGGCVEVEAASVTLGAAVINGEAPPGRRRMTLAHELGHWLTGDAYDTAASTEAERMLNSFAIHFLAPRAGVIALWNERQHRPTRDRALTVSATFRLSWSATVGQLHNLGLVDFRERAALEAEKSTTGEFVQLGLKWTDELGSPSLSPGFAAACVGGYVAGKLTADRTVELLRGTLLADELPRPREGTLDDLRRSFQGHGA